MSQCLPLPGYIMDLSTLTCRVLIYLEAEARGTPGPTFAAHLQEDLLAAALALGLRSLEV